MDASSGELVELLADELVPQQTFVPLPEGANNWTPVTGVEWEWYVGPVYSLDVEYDHAYVADGIVVLNSIYKWRSAEPTLFVDFSKNPDVQSLVLPLNYRSNQTICSVSTGIVRGKPWHIAGDIISTRQILHPDAIKIKEYETVEMEAEDVVRQCRELGVENGLRSSVVLSRLKVGLDLVEIACIRQRVPYIKMASGSFFESKEVRDILGYLRVAANYDPDGSWMRHIINKPFRFIGLPTIAKATAMAEARNMALLDCLCEVSDELHFRQRKAVRELAQLLQDMNALSVKADAHELAVSQATPMPVANPLEYTSAPEKMIGMVLDRTGYVEELRREEGLLGMDESRVAALAALKRMASLFSTAAPFLAYVDALTVAVQEAKRAGLRLKEGTTKDALTLSTIHRIKGMEANNIFLVDVAQGRFPCAKSTDPDEELRLLYVAVTRAADFCQVSYASGSNGIKSSHISLLERELKMVVRT
jgi:DNA helicase-2/ATP-dependent DNA helicase PcrA